MSSILGIMTGRISDQYVYQRLTAQVDTNLTQLTQLETELSTGDQFQLPSQDPAAAQQVISLQALLAKKQQAQSNVASAQSFLSEADSAMTTINNLMSQARATAVGAVGSTVTAAQQQAAAQTIQQAIQQLIDVGNEMFQNSYLFAGSNTRAKPFSTQGNNVEYLGNDQNLNTYTDVNQLSQTSVPGSQVFGGLSQPVGAGVDLQPGLTFQTRLSDLHLGQGVDKGSIAISNGSSTSIVDLSGADTIGDVANLIRGHPPAGSTLDVQLTSQGLQIQLDSSGGPGNLSITEVGDGTTAHDLGIYNSTGVGNHPLVGSALDPKLTATTPLDDILGTRAQAVIPSPGGNGNILLQAQTAGSQYNGATITIENDPNVHAGKETVAYNPTTMAVTVHVAAGQTTVQQVVAALDKANTAGTIPFTASLDPVAGEGDGSTLVSVTPAGQVSATTAGGGGQPLDQASGLQIVNGGSTYHIDISQCRTVQDLLNTLNGAGAGVLAGINQAGTGIQVQSRLSGCDFSIGENGGATATQLGLRTLSADTPLSDLNYGQGVTLGQSTGTNTTTSQATKGQTILSGTNGGSIQLVANTAGQAAGNVAIVYNMAPGNTAATNASYSNGVLTVNLQTSAWGLAGSQPAQDVTGGGGLLAIAANVKGAQFNGLKLVVTDNGGAASNTATYNYATNTITADVDTATTTDSDLANLINTQLSSLFTATASGTTTTTVAASSGENLTAFTDDAGTDGGILTAADTYTAVASAINAAAGSPVSATATGTTAENAAVVSPFTQNAAYGSVNAGLSSDLNNGIQLLGGADASSLPITFVNNGDNQSLSVSLTANTATNGYSTAYVQGAAPNSTIQITADNQGTQYDGITVTYAQSTTDQSVVYDAAAKTITVTNNFNGGAVTAADVISQINTALGAGAGKLFTASSVGADDTGVVTAGLSGTTCGGNPYAGIVVNLGTDSKGNITSTASDVINAINASTQLQNLGISASNLGSSSGTGFLTAGATSFTQPGLTQANGYAQATTVNQGGVNSEMTVTVKNAGSLYNNVSVVFVNDPAVTAHSGEYAQYDAGTKQLQIHIDSGVSTLQDVLNNFNATSSPAAAGLFTLSAVGNASGVLYSSDTGTLTGGVTNTGTATGAVALAGNFDASGTAQDFTITRADGVSMSISLAGCQTIGDVLNAINNNSQNTPAVSGGPPALVAQLSPQGNGIQLVDNSVGARQLTVTQASGSSAAVDLGLIPAGQTSQSASAASTAAAATVTSAGGNNDLVFSSNSDTFGNGWQIVFQDSTNPPSFRFDAANKVMTFDIDAGVTTANDIISMFNANAQAKADFSLSLGTDGGANNGTGAVADNTAAAAVLSGGTPQTLTGSDPNPQEVGGLFTALSRIQDGLTTGNTQEVDRGVSLLDTAVTQLNFVQAGVGAKQQGLQAQATNLTNQTTQLQSNLSSTQDIDMTQVITQLTADQATFQASLEAIGKIFKLTLLDYL